MVIPVKGKLPVLTTFLSALRKSELKKLIDLLPQLFWGSDKLALIVFFEVLCVLSTKEILPMMSSFLICKGLLCTPSEILSTGASTWVSTFSSYLPFEYVKIPLKWLSSAFTLANIDLEVSKVKFVWCLVTHSWSWLSHPKYLQYFIKSESYKEYWGKVPLTERLKELGPVPDSLVRVTELKYLNPFVVPELCVGAVFLNPAVVTSYTLSSCITKSPIVYNT